MVVFQLLLFFVCLIGFYKIGLVVALRQANLQDGAQNLNSLPQYFGYLLALCFTLVAVLLFLVWQLVEVRYIQNYVIGRLPVALLAQYTDQYPLLFGKLGNNVLLKLSDPQLIKAAHILQSAQQFNAKWLPFCILLIASMAAGTVCVFLRKLKSVRRSLEQVIKFILLLCSVIAIFSTIGIVLSVLFEAIRFFQLVSIFDFLFGTHWSPQTSLRTDQVASEGSFGSLPLFIGTLQISFLAMLIAVPIGLFSAIYLAEYASKKAAKIIKPILEILAGIPTVVYGFFAALTLGPLVRDIAQSVGISASSESMIATSIIMGIMIVPFISSLSHDILNAVPQALRDGSFAIGSTKSEMIKFVLLPAALPGIVSSILLAMSRAIGETMIVVMAAGLTAQLTLNPFDSVTTVTVQIVSLLVGDQEFNSAKTLSAFALGLVLFIITLILNIIALQVVKRYREIYH